MRHLAVTIVLIVAAPTGAVAQETTTTTDGVPEVAISDLIAEAELWDERRVAVIGELVGDFSPRDDGVWVQVNGDVFIDSPVAAGGEPLGLNIGVGARIPRTAFDAGVVGSPGRYGRVGPIVELVGIFKHNDAALTGETYLDVEQVTTLEPSRAYATAGADSWLGIGVGLLVLALAIALVTRQRSATDG